MRQYPRSRQGRRLTPAIRSSRRSSSCNTHSLAAADHRAAPGSRGIIIRTRRLGYAGILAGFFFAATGLCAQMPTDLTPGGGVYAMAGLGVADLDRGTGVGVPLRLTVIEPGLKAMVSATPLDLTFVQGDQDPRYDRVRDPFTGAIACYDTERGGRRVSDLECSSTDVVRSMSAEAALVPFDAIFFAGKEAMVFAGIGFRFEKPETPYGTLGLFFPTRSGKGGEFRLSIGGEFIYIGVSWGYELTHLVRGRSAAAVFTPR